MRLKFIALSGLGMFLGFAVLGGGAPSGSTNAVSQATNTVVAKQTTGVTTNGVAKPATNALVAAKDPGDDFTNSVGMELTKVGGGYWAGKYEVTQKEYQEVMGSNPSAFSGDKRPVESVTWNDAMDFCRKLTEKDIKENALPTGYSYSLPTEEEWQMLAAGTSLASAVTSQSGTRSATSPVGSLAPNGLGLYDVRGNVAEWTLGDPSKPFRVALGGSWQDWIEINLRPEFRTYLKLDETKNTVGFRCLLKKKR